MYSANVPALPGPATPAEADGPPVLAPFGRVMFRVLDQRSQSRPAGR